MRILISFALGVAKLWLSQVTKHALPSRSIVASVDCG